MTYDELAKLVADYNEPAKLMMRERFNLPQVIRYVAEDMFVNDDRSEFSKLVRHQLKHLHDHGVFDLKKD